PADFVGDPDPARSRLRPQRRRQHRLCHRLRRARGAQAAGRCQDRGHRIGGRQRRGRRADRTPQRRGRRLAPGIARQTSRYEQAGRTARVFARRQQRGVGNVELHPPSRVAGADDDAEACIRYLDRLPLAPEQRAVLLRRVAGDVGTIDDSVRAKMLRLHEALAGGGVDADNPALASIRQRLELAYGASDDGHAPPLTHDALGRDHLVTAPPLTRTSMVPHAWPRGLLARWFLRFSRQDAARAGTAERSHAAGGDPIQRAPKHREAWRRAATLRRLVLMGLIVSQTYIASNFMVAVLPYHGRQPLE